MSFYIGEPLQIEYLTKLEEITNKVGNGYLVEKCFSEIPSFIIGMLGNQNRNIHDKRYSKFFNL